MSGAATLPPVELSPDAAPAGRVDWLSPGSQGCPGN